MKLKVCSKCKERKELKNFSKNKTKQDNLQASCKACHSVYLKNHYLKNKNYYKEKAKISNVLYKEQIQSYVRNLKENNPCSDCRKYFPYYVMDFDHLRDKKFSIAFACARVFSIKRIKQELNKCQLVCSNCHRKRSFRRGY